MILHRTTTHAPARGATMHCLPDKQAENYFNSPPPVRGATRLSPIVIDTLQLQLTHPRGVRLHGTFLLLVLWCFNSRAREGCDLQSCNISPALAPSTLAPPHGVRLLRRPVRTSAEVLQLTHPRGVRPNGVRFKIYRNSFNSCTREGCDLYKPLPHLYKPPLTHAPRIQ